MLTHDLRAGIVEKHRDLKLQWGWRLLYSPLETLTSNSGIAFIGLNPGGEGTKQEMASTGCAYLDEKWGGEVPGESHLQKQVQAMFELVAKAWDNNDAEKLLRRSLSGNLVPFQSPSWAHLGPHRNKCAEFGGCLWREIIDTAKPRLVLTMTKKVSNQLLRAYGINPKYESRNTGWGTIQWRIARISKKTPFHALVSLPHLSRFGIFLRKEADFEKAFVEECRKVRSPK